MAADYYSLLDISDSATQAEVKRAYRRAALKSHPDVNKAPDARQRFMEVVEAYETLSDAKKRSDYDRRRRFGGGFASGFGGRGSGSSYSPPRGSGSGGGGGGAGSYNDAARAEARREYARQNPTADDIDDSFGRILGDLLTGLASGASSGRGVVEDFVTFLEQQIDGFGDDMDASLEELLASSDLKELRAEAEAAELLLTQLRRRIAHLETERADADRRAAAWKAARAAGGSSGGSGARSARSLEELEEGMALVDRAAGLAARLQAMQGHTKRAQRRLQRLQRRIDQLTGSGGSRSSGSGSSGSSYGPRPPDSGAGPRAAPRRKELDAAVDDELRRMKKDLGMQ